MDLRERELMDLSGYDSELCVVFFLRDVPCVPMRR